jgi:hypothetical protein
MTGAVLPVLFVAECLTLLNIGNLLTLHVFLGMLLLGPVSLKIRPTLGRFTRYYTGSPAYVRKGPPAPLQRVTGPFVILIIVAVLGTGIMLVVEGPGHGNWSWRSPPVTSRPNLAARTASSRKTGAWPRPVVLGLKADSPRPVDSSGRPSLTGNHAGGHLGGHRSEPPAGKRRYQQRARGVGAFARPG